MPAFRCNECGTFHSSATILRRHWARHHGRVVPDRMTNSGTTGGRGRVSSTNNNGDCNYASAMERIKNVTTTAMNDAFMLPVDAAVREIQAKARGTAGFIVEGIVRGIAESLPRVMLQHELFLRANAASRRAVAAMEREGSCNVGLLIDVSDRSAEKTLEQVQVSAVQERNLLDMSLEPLLEPIASTVGEPFEKRESNGSKQRPIDVDETALTPETASKVPDLELEEIFDAAEYPIVVHGTYTHSWREIKYQGLKPMGRKYIHLATGEAKVDGGIRDIRGSRDVLIYIDIQRALNDGIKFYRSANNVVLCPGNEQGILSNKYFAYAVQRHTRKNLPL